MEQKKMQVSTQIRTFYSDKMSCLSLKFYNVNLSIQFYPYKGDNQNGRPTYDTKNGETTTIDFQSAYALYETGNKIINNEISEVLLSVPCGFDAQLILERKYENNVLETYLSISKNGRVIPFKFNKIEKQEKENNQIITKYIEAGLGSFIATIYGYLNEINGSLHLNKLTEEYAKSQAMNNQQQVQNNQNNKNNYNRGNSYKPNNYAQKAYNRGGYYQQNNQNKGGYQQPSMNNYNFQK